TIGLIGMHEALLNLIGKGIDTPEGKAYAEKTMHFMRDRIREYQDETGSLFNLEATPGEGTTYRLASKDRKDFPDIITSGKDEPYYTNSTQLPVDATEDIFEALKHQDTLQSLYTGGTVLHGFLGERIEDWRTVAGLARKIAHGFHLPYFSFTPTFSICPQHGYLTGEHFQCPTCGSDAEVWSRVVGFYRPVQQWNKGKKEEYRDRREFLPNDKAVKVAA
ncbi:MAG: anaerobic ribonucleoside-triphosphate reductase, partial [Desulfobulbaceae bacterium]